MLIDSIAQWFSSGLGSPSLLVSGAFVLLYAILVSILMFAFAYLFGWVERKLLAKLQYRHGPTYLGPFGSLQNFADLIKLLAKEAVSPQGSDRILLGLVPLVLVATTIFIVLLLPFTPGVQASNFGLGLLFVFVILSFSPLLMFIAGTSTNNKLAAIGAQRSVLMLISYEIPLLIVMIGVALAAHGFSLDAVLAAQSSLPFVILMPLGFIVFFLVMLAEMERPPFDLREADSELIAGWLTDISAPYYALVLLLDYSRMFMGSLLIAILFFGGWSGPILPPIVWLVLKAVIISLAIVVIRATAMRMRIDRVLRFGWLYLMPLALLNLLITFIILK